MAIREETKVQAAALGVVISVEHTKSANPNGRLTPSRVIQAKLPGPTGLRARFVEQGLVESAKKLFLTEVEVGAAEFDDHVYVVTSTHEATRRMLDSATVQSALRSLVKDGSSVVVEGDTVRAVQEERVDDDSDDIASVLAVAAALLTSTT
jgi:hypothetical protein